MLTGREQGTDNMDPAASGMVHLNGPQALAWLGDAVGHNLIGEQFPRHKAQLKAFILGQIGGKVGKPLCVCEL